mgnify:CR=1 FL=1
MSLPTIQTDTNSKQTPNKNATSPGGGSKESVRTPSPVSKSPTAAQFTAKRKYLQTMTAVVGEIPLGTTWRDEFHTIAKTSSTLPKVYSVAHGRIAEIHEYGAPSNIDPAECMRVLVYDIQCFQSMRPRDLKAAGERFGRVLHADVFERPRSDQKSAQDSAHSLQIVFRNGQFMAVRSNSERESLCCGIIDFSSPEEAQRAVRGLRTINGYIVSVTIGTLTQFLRYADRWGYPDEMMKKMTRLHQWHDATAEMLHLLLVYGSIAIGAAVRERRQGHLTASCHSLARVIAERAKSSQEVAPLLYLPLRGRPDLNLPYGLIDVEPDAIDLLEPETMIGGGVHSSAPRVLFDGIDYMTPEGNLLYDRHRKTWPLCDSDVVCIKSLPTSKSEPYLQTAVLFAGSPAQQRYVLPPNTLLTLQKIEGPPFVAHYRRWVAGFSDGRAILACREANGDVKYFYEVLVDGQVRYKREITGHLSKLHYSAEEIGYDPTATIDIEVNRRLLTLTPRYMLPTELACHSGL